MLELFYVPQCSHLKNKLNSNNCLTGLLWGLNEVTLPSFSFLFFSFPFPSLVFFFFLSLSIFLLTNIYWVYSVCKWWMVNKTNVTLIFKESTVQWARLFKKVKYLSNGKTSHGKWYEGIKQKSEMQNNGSHFSIYLGNYGLYGKGLFGEVHLRWVLENKSQILEGNREGGRTGDEELFLSCL